MKRLFPIFILPLVALLPLSPAHSAAPADSTAAAAENAVPSPTAAAETAPAKKVVTDYALRAAKELQPTRTLVYKTLPDRKLEMRDGCRANPEGSKPLAGG